MDEFIGLVLLGVAVSLIFGGTDEETRKKEKEERERLIRQDQYRRQQEAEACHRRERYDLAKEAQEAGHTVCWKCLTIDPEKFCSRCGNCMACGNGEYYPDLCYDCDSGD